MPSLRADTQPDRRRLTGAARTLGPLLLASVAIALGVAGCSRPLLSPKDQRSQFDRYDKARNQYAPQFVEDEYGRKKPNLRGRLSQKE